MMKHEIFQRLNALDRVSEVYELVCVFKLIRQSSRGNMQEVRVEVFDAGEDENPYMRYHCCAFADDGAKATGNPSSSVEAVLAQVHWWDLDKP